MKIDIYTDGSCRANKIGGIGIVWLKDGIKVREFSKSFENCTNNIMELMAIYIALQSVKEPIDSLEIISDSEYSIGVITKPWNPKKNIELIAKIKNKLNETQQLVSSPIIFTHIKGHNGNIYNELADTLATKASL